MKKVILVFMMTFLISGLCLPQDVITLKAGELIRSKILEIGQKEIKYKKFDNQNGPVYVVAKSDILNIVYENGTKDIFTGEQKEIDTIKVNNMPERVAKAEVNVSAPDNAKKSRFLIGFLRSTAYRYLARNGPL